MRSLLWLPGWLVACTPSPSDETPDETGDTGATAVAVDTGDPDPDGRDDTRHSPDLRWRLSWGEEVACPAPELREEAWFDVETLAIQVPRAPYVAAGGITVADLTGDGIVDLVTSESEQVRLWRGSTSGVFTPSLLLEEPPAYREAFMTATAVDLDGDGDLDLSVTRQEGQHHMLVNDGTGAFADRTEALGLQTTRGFWGMATWGDMDRDGDLDLFLAGHAFINEERLPDIEKFVPTNSIVFEQRDGVFVDVTDDVLPEVVGPMQTFEAAWVDVDEDGWLDLWLANDFSRDWVVSRFVRGTPSGWSTEGLTHETIVTSMGVAFEDFDGDRKPELFVPGWGENALYVRRDGQWFDAARVAGVFPDFEAPQQAAWAGASGDLDNDGDLDLPVGYGYLNTIISDTQIRGQRDALYVNQGGLLFSDEAAGHGFDQDGPTRGIAVVDLDGDLWLDVVKTDLEGRLFVFRARCGQGRAVSLRIEDEASPNRHGIGALLVAEHGDAVSRRRMHAGGGTGYGVSLAPMWHVGVGSATTIDRLEVTLPDGDHAVFRDVPTHRPLTLTRYTAPAR